MNAPLPILTAHVLDEPRIDLIDLMFARLASLLDSESQSLLRLAEPLGLPAISQILQALENLHRTQPNGDLAALREARALLARLLAILRAIPSVASVHCPCMPGDQVLVRDLNAVVRWCGARVEDHFNALSSLTADEPEAGTGAPGRNPG